MIAIVIAPEEEPPDAAGAAVTVGAAPVAPPGAALAPGLSGDPAPAAVSVRTGAGFSGSGPPGGVGSIHRTTDPSEYVCSVLNAIEAGLRQRAQLDREFLELARLDRGRGRVRRPDDLADGLRDLIAVIVRDRLGQLRHRHLRRPAGHGLVVHGRDRVVHVQMYVDLGRRRRVTLGGHPQRDGRERTLLGRRRTHRHVRPGGARECQGADQRSAGDDTATPYPLVSHCGSLEMRTFRTAALVVVIGGKVPAGAAGDRLARQAGSSASAPGDSSRSTVSGAGPTSSVLRRHPKPRAPEHDDRPAHGHAHQARKAGTRRP